MQIKGNVLPVLFCTVLLCIACLVRSEIVVDSTFLPRYLALTLLLLAVMLAWFRRKIVLQKSWFEGAFVLFYLWNLLSCFRAISSSEAIMQSQFVFISFVVFVVVTGFCTQQPAFERTFIRVLLVSLYFSFGLAFFRMFSLQFFDPYMIHSVSANNNLYSGFLLISLPLVLAGYSMHKGFWRYISLLAGVLSVFFIIIVQSRAGYLGLFIAFSIVLAVSAVRYKSVFSGRNILTGIAALLLLLSGILLFYSSLDTTRRNYFLSKVPVWNYLKSPDILEAEKEKKQTASASGDLNHIPAFDFSEAYYENASLRFIFWKKSACLVSQHPIAGTGAGNWRLAIPSCKEPPNPEHTVRNYTYSQPHNEWIGLLAELGIVGFLLGVMVFFIPPGIVFFRIFSSSSKPDFTSVIYASFVLGFYIFACFDFPFRRVEHTVLLFSILAFLLFRKRIRTSAAKVHPSLFALLLIFSFVVGAARITGEYYTAKMFRQELRNDAEVIRLCREGENMFYRITPNTLPLAWFEGVAYFRTGDASSAAGCFSRAIRSTPYEVRVLNDYGICLYQLHQINEGKSMLLKSIEIDPYFDDAKFNLAAICFLSGQKDSALYYVQRCRDSQKKKDYLEELK